MEDWGVVVIVIALLVYLCTKSPTYRVWDNKKQEWVKKEKWEIDP